MCSYEDTDVAIIGYSTRLPGANSIEEFWNNIKNGKDCVTRSENTDQLKVNAFGKLDGIYDFDASFFGMSDNQAMMTDPQQRMLLTLCYEALENAGCYQGNNHRIGLFAGSADFYYVWKTILNNTQNPDLEKMMRSAYLDGTLTSRISYILGLTGPSMTIKNACSTGLVAIHLAVESLLNGDCDIAIAGGISIVESQDGYYPAESTMSKQGVTCSFDKNADGFVPANGGVVFVLKRAVESQEANDCIHAVIKGSAINNDGKRKESFSAPSVSGEAQAIRDALEIAGVAPDSIDYVEMHGTATGIGDLIELESLKQGYQLEKGQDRVLTIGSVKSNIGHTNFAAGAAGLLKTVLMLEHKQIVPSINYHEMNEESDANEYGIEVATQLKDWKSELRLAGVSSFGIGGQNCHIILQEALEEHEVSSNSEKEEENLLLVSAKSKQSLKRLLYKYQNYFQEKQDISMESVATTLCWGRKAYPYRAYIAARNAYDAATQLGKRVPIKEITNSNLDGIMLFDGSRILSSEEISAFSNDKFLKKYFKQAFDCIESISGDRKDVSYEEDNMIWSFVTEYALAKFMLEIGFVPKAVIGYSSGEYLAAYFAGVMTLSDCFTLLLKRNELMETLPSGNMLSVLLTQEEFAVYQDGSYELSGINADGRIMISASTKQIETLKEKLDKDNVMYVDLHLERAGHYSKMNAIIPDFKKLVEQEITLSKPKIPFISPSTGSIVGEEIISSEFWCNQLLACVDFQAACHYLCKHYSCMVIEMGVGEQLCNYFKKNAMQYSEQYAVSMGAKRQGKSYHQAILNAVGYVWSCGYSLNMEKVISKNNTYVSLPSYVFENKEYCYKPTNQVNHYNEDFVIMDGLSETMYQLSRFICEKNPNNLKIYTNHNVEGLSYDLSTSKEFCEEMEWKEFEQCPFKEILNKDFYDEIYGMYDYLCCVVAGDCFKAFHLFAKVNHTYTYDDILESMKAEKKYVYLVDFLLSNLLEFGYLIKEEEKFTVLKPISELPNLDSILEEYKTKYPDFAKHLDLVGWVSQHYPDIISGKKNGKEVLYPNGSYEMVRAVTDQTPTYQAPTVYINLVCKIIEHIVRSEKRRIRILEIGSGSGIVSWPLLEQLKNCDIEYWYTDIGLPFLSMAREKSKKLGYKNVTFQRVDISKPLSEQNVPTQYFDLVISCGVLQSTADIKYAFQNGTSALCDGGLQVVMQPVVNRKIRVVIGGILDDWWYYKNDAYRKDGLNISSEQWKELYQESGYKNTLSLEGIKDYYTDSVVMIGQYYQKDRYINQWKEIKHSCENCKLEIIPSFEPEDILDIVTKYEQDGISVLMPDNLKNSLQELKNKKQTQVLSLDKQDSTMERLQKLVAEIIGTKIEDVHACIYDYNIDSLTVLMICSRIKIAFDIEFGPGDLLKCNCLQEIRDCIAAKESGN